MEVVRIEFLSKLSQVCPLFRETDFGSRELRSALARGEISSVSFSCGDTIYPRSPADAPQLVILTAGKASVLTPDPTHAVLLRFLKSGDLFGIANLFSGPDTPFVSVVRAETDCTCVFVSERTVCELLNSDRAFRESYISYLSGRVRFLNRKIGYLTAGSAERRLALYLAGLGQGEIKLSESISSLSERLNIGRASLYRAFDRLQADGYLVKDGKCLRLTDVEAMLEHYHV